VGYVWGWREDADLATVYTVCDIPKVSSFTGSTVPKLEIGDVAIVIGSAAGLDGTVTQGAIANVKGSGINSSVRHRCARQFCARQVCARQARA